MLFYFSESTLFFRDKAYYLIGNTHKKLMVKNSKVIKQYTIVKRNYPLSTQFSLEVSTDTGFLCSSLETFDIQKSKCTNIAPAPMVVCYIHCSAFFFLHLMYIRDPFRTKHILPRPLFTAAYYSILWMFCDLFKQFGTHLFQTLFILYQWLVSA